ncbi:MAG: LysM peptidoglycan-binding domain-containing protein [Chloroflexota bacterium]|nr:LysM peptidoglycan-binding domain-containing protein [Chloroflexota bacterium]
MSRNLSYKGKGQDTGPVALPVGDDLQDSSQAKRNGKSATRLSLSTPSARRTDRAIDDAQSSLDSLIKAPYSHADRSRPQVISSSGRVRNQTRGRIAAPASLTSETPSAGRTARPLYILGEGLNDVDDRALAIVPGTVPLYGPDGEMREVPNTALGRGMALATGTLQTAKEHAGLLLGTLDAPNGLGLADAETLHTSRRAASQWATRYATHMVVLLVVAVLVALGGLRALTTEGSYASDLHSAEELGTDHFHDAEAEFGGEAIDSPDFVVALPRTELGGADAAANSIVAPRGPSGEEAQVPPQTDSPPAPAPIGKVTEYTVASGDTVGSIAAKFKLMPETVMGSNGIYDSEEVLAVGRVLAVPPIDGMHYVAKEGDTVQSIADRFQVDAEVITSFAGNNLANGTVAAGQAVIVPGGMMPPRDVAVVYTVRKGDTLKRVAARYGIDVPTVLHANDIPDPDNLSIGSELRLLPVPGLEYEIKKGDTIFSIADKLGVSAEMILDYPPNGLKADSVLQIGAKIMVPGGSPPVVMAARVAPPASKEEPAPQPPVKQKPATSKSAPAPASAVKPPPKAEPAPAPKPPPAANTPKKGTGSMVWPVRGRITQYFSGRHNGLDIATKAGTPIHAADSGKIIWSGWRTDGLGYCVIIDHLNGITTIYGHMIRQPPVRVGSYVDRNQVIGYIGSTGRSTGPHVHFMVKTGGGKTYRNPLAYLGK